MNSVNYGKSNPLVLVNFKCLEESSAENGLKLVSSLDRAVTDTGLQIGICVQSFFVSEYKSKSDLLVLGQHLDANSYGSFTGANLAESLKFLGGWGSLVNHSERRLSSDLVMNTVKRMREVGLKSVVCVESVAEAAEYALFNPDFIAIEPPELIGGDISVSTARPELISEAVDAVGSIPLLVGAGIKNGEDLKVALNLGAVGILVASGVCKADNPYDVILDFAEAIN